MGEPSERKFLMVHKQVQEVMDEVKSSGLSMLSQPALENIAELVHSGCRKGLRGDFVEAGVWRGGGSMVAKAAVKAYCGNTRKIFVCDSFEGLPVPERKYAADKYDLHHTYDDLKISQESVQNHFRIAGLLDEHVLFHKGFFNESMPKLRAQVNKIMVLRLDGDMYSSTLEVLRELYDKVEVGGYVIVDDFFLPNCYAAVFDFFTCFSIEKNLTGIRQRPSDKPFEFDGVKYIYKKVYWEKRAEVPADFREQVEKCPQLIGTAMKKRLYTNYLKRQRRGDLTKPAARFPPVPQKYNVF